MLKAQVVGDTPQTGARRRSAELPNEIQGQIEEVCYELVVQVKRMRQLQDQAYELRTVIRQWAREVEADRTTNQLAVEDDAEK